MNTLTKRLLAGLLALPVSVALILVLSLSLTPDVKTPEPLTHEQLIELKKTLSAVNPLKRQRPGLKHVVIKEETANQSLQLLTKNFYNIPSNVKFKENFAIISGSYQIPFIPIRLFVNINLELTNNKSIPEIQKMAIGNLPIPSFIFDLTMPIVLKHFENNFSEYYKTIESIQIISIKEEQVSVTYEWNYRFSKFAQNFGKNLLLGKDQQERIAIYYEHLSKMHRSYLWKATSLTKMIQPLFKLANQRVSHGKNVIEENKAVLMTLGIVASGIRINHLIKTKNNRALRHIYFGRLSLLNRTDLMRHFLLSAALTVSTNKILTDTIGLSKEMSDADGGSGFSFADLLADRAGVTLAKAAIDPLKAVAFQEYLANETLTETDIMPLLDNLPESISTLQFQRTYVNINHPNYLKLETEIKQRIEHLPIHNIL